ncbi:MAG: DUF115 domain-containing protein [Planctomycetes bacterium]|nr:DUF115 domain-containing protein [Planctomycetota bacterium]
MPLTVPAAQAAANVASCLARGLPMLGNSPVVLCGPGPSLLETWPKVADLARQGAEIWALKGTWRFLVSQGIRPDVVALMDPHPSQVKYTAGAPAGMAWYVATHCDPSVFEALNSQRVVAWHAGRSPHVGPGDHIVSGTRDILTRVLAILVYQRRPIVTLAGCDCSWRPLGGSHVYELARGFLDQEMIRTVTHEGVSWMTTPKMGEDIQLIVQLMADRKDDPTLPEIEVLGDSLLASVARAWRAWSAGPKDRPFEYGDEFKRAYHRPMLSGLDFLDDDDLLTVAAE